jgi:hypothetical protein
VQLELEKIQEASRLREQELRQLFRSDVALLEELEENIAAK